MADEWLKQYTKDVDRVPKWDTKRCSFRDFSMEWCAWMTIKGYYTQENLQTI